MKLQRKTIRKKKSSKKIVKKKSSKKIANKKLVKKKPVKKIILETFHVPRTNRIAIIFPKGRKSLDDIITALIQYDWNSIVKQMKAHKKRNPLTKRMAYVPPKSFYVILRLLKPNGIEQYFTEIAPYDMVVNLNNIQELTIKTIENLFESWTSARDVKDSGVLDEGEEDNEAIEYMDKLDMRYLKEIIYHFLYLK